jgi:hypothetical protein
MKDERKILDGILTVLFQQHDAHFNKTESSASYYYFEFKGDDLNAD